LRDAGVAIGIGSFEYLPDVHTRLVTDKHTASAADQAESLKNSTDQHEASRPRLDVYPPRLEHAAFVSLTAPIPVSLRMTPTPGLFSASSRCALAAPSKAGPVPAICRVPAYQDARIKR
jgi:hypothetical protein